jgi:hypothetical protein
MVRKRTISGGKGIESLVKYLPMLPLFRRNDKGLVTRAAVITPKLVLIVGITVPPLFKLPEEPCISI